MINTKLSCVDLNIYFLKMHCTYSSWNQSPVQDGHSECAGINVQGKMEDISCYSRQGYICKYSPGEFSFWCVSATNSATVLVRMQASQNANSLRIFTVLSAFLILKITVK